MRKSKYRNHRTEVDGIKFHSKKEAGRYVDLKLLVLSKDIAHLERQKKFPLVVNGLDVGTYICDFYYLDRRNGKYLYVVEDVKPFDKKRRKYLTTKDFDLKWKLAQALHPNVDEWRFA